ERSDGAQPVQGLGPEADQGRPREEDRLSGPERRGQLAAARNLDRDDGGGADVHPRQRGLGRRCEGFAAPHLRGRHDRHRLPGSPARLHRWRHLCPGDNWNGALLSGTHILWTGFDRQSFRLTVTNPVSSISLNDEPNFFPPATDTLAAYDA